MSFTKINAKIVFSLFILVILTLFVVYFGNNEKHSNNSIGNISNDSKDTNRQFRDSTPEKTNNTSFGGTVIVYPGDSIQEKINNASLYSTILVYPGLYKENLVVNKSLAIIAKQDKLNNTVIQAADPEKDVFHVTADNVTISGFNITGSQSKAGIYYIGSYGDIEGNLLVYNEYGAFLNNSQSITIMKNIAFQNGFGVYLESSGENILENNDANNSSHYGIYLDNSSENKLNSNTAYLNGGYAVYLKNSNNNWLISNNISNLDIMVDRNGIDLENSSNNKLMSNYVSDSWEGINLTKSSGNKLNKNIISHNYFSVKLENSNDNELLNNTIELHPYTFSITLWNSQNNTFKSNNKEIKIEYTSNSRNNTFEGEQYTDNGQGTGGVFRVR